ncbi:reverse transcriptase domain-containing protein [Haloimpatiens massiliensis]|uniref:reverse transcriptase domain-containing protein n=1 Tax=Haloimpatiens massiliensis TaxID=1658110 RepID=UPI003119E9A3
MARTMWHCGVKGFFDHMNHDWIMKFLGVYIKDPNILWLIKKYLKAGVMTDGVFKESIDGSVQGNIMSPIIANIYMHNVLILWYKIILSKEIKGDSFLVVYADDFIAGFQYKWEAENTMNNLRKEWRSLT